MKVFIMFNTGWWFWADFFYVNKVKIIVFESLSNFDNFDYFLDVSSPKIDSTTWM